MALDCIKGSIRPNPPLLLGWINTFQATLAIVGDPYLPPQRKFRIKLCIFVIADLENSQTDAINHIEANNTEFATTT